MMVLLLAGAAHALPRDDCDSLLALRIAREADAALLADCSTAVVATPGPLFTDCAGQTANACARDRWEEPEAIGLLAPGGSGTLVARYAPRCRDGSDTCGPEDEVHCVDGSRPLYWVEETGSPAWVLYFRGGSSCRERIEPSGDTAVADDCSDRYFGNFGQESERGEMSSVGQFDHYTGQGILNPTAKFGSYNRLFVHKCTFDWYTGDTTLADETDRTGERFDLHFHGRRVLEAVAAAEGIDGTSLVLFSGSSAGAGSVVHNADWFRDLTGAAVRAVAASYFRPGPELEASCGDADCTGGDAYAGDFAGTSAWSAVGDFDETSYVVPGGRRGTWFSTWTPDGVPFDASCAAAHAADPWRCWSTEHVLLNHVTTPTFVYQSTRDRKFTNPVDDAAYVDWDQDPGPAFPTWDATHFEVRVEAQAESFAQHGVDGAAREEPFVGRTAHPLGYFLRDTDVHEVLEETSGWYTQACLAAGPLQVDLFDALQTWLRGFDVRLREGAGPWVAGASCVP